MRLLLVRHGQSEWNATRRLQGQADIGLSAHGADQARALMSTIKQIGPDRIVASDLKRVRETAALIANSKIHYTAALREIDVGEWTGRYISDIRAESEENYAGWRAGTYVPPGGESWADFVARTASVVEKERATPCRDLLMVCHGGVIRAILHHYIGLEPARIIPVAPASLSALRLGNGKPPRLELFNYRSDRLDFGAPD